MPLFGDSAKKIDEDLDNRLAQLFKELDLEQDSTKKARILEKIRQTQEEYKQKKKKGILWKLFK